MEKYLSINNINDLKRQKLTFSEYQEVYNILYEIHTKKI